VVAGHPPEAHEKTLDILQRQHIVEVKGQSDVVVYGMGNNRDPYSKMSLINPILVLWGQGAYGFRHLGKVFLAGATDFEVARLLGFEPFSTVEEAIGEAERLIGKDCSIAYPEMHDSFICNVEG